MDPVGLTLRTDRYRRQVSDQTERPLRADARRNRDQIMAAARDLFARLGDRAQMDEVAAAGVGTGTLYRHFPASKR